MPLTRDFIETIRERAQREPEFRAGILGEALSCILNGEVSIGRILMSDYIEVAIGFAELSRRTGRSLESLMHMFGDRGSAQADDLLEILDAMAEHEKIELDVQVESRSLSEQLVEA